MCKELEYIVDVKSLKKTYDKVEAVKGELLGLIGSDGAGKTSVFRILTILMFPTEGEVSILDFDVIKEYKKIRSNIGYVPQRFLLYQDF